MLTKNSLTKSPGQQLVGSDWLMSVKVLIYCEAFEKELKTIPMRRWGEATDIAGVAIMLASKAGAFITGQIIPIDGGTSVVN